MDEVTDYSSHFTLPKYKRYIYTCSQHSLIRTLKTHSDIVQYSKVVYVGLRSCFTKKYLSISLTSVSVQCEYPNLPVIKNTKS